MKFALSERASNDGESVGRSAALIALLLGEMESDDDTVEVDVAEELAVEDLLATAEPVVSREPSSTSRGAGATGGGTITTTTGTAIGGAGGGSGGAGGSGTGMTSTGTMTGAGGGGAGGSGGTSGGGTTGGSAADAEGDTSTVLTDPTASMKIGCVVGANAGGDGHGVS